MKKIYFYERNEGNEVKEVGKSYIDSNVITISRNNLFATWKMGRFGTKQQIIREFDIFWLVLDDWNTFYDELNLGIGCENMLKVIIIDKAKNTIVIDLWENEYKELFKEKIDSKKIKRHKTKSDLYAEISEYLKEVNDK